MLPPLRPPAWATALVVLASIAGPVRSQVRESEFVRYTHADGLSSNFIHSLAQDYRGFLWIGTEYGLNRFDGDRFQAYQQQAPEGFLPSSQVHKLISLGGERLAILTRNGALILREKDYAVLDLRVPDSTVFGPILNDTWDLAELPDGHFVLATAAGLYLFDPAGRLVFRHDAYGPADRGRRTIRYARRIFPLPDGRVFVHVEAQGQVLLDVEARRVYPVDPVDPAAGPLCHPSREKPWITAARIGTTAVILMPHADSLYYQDPGRGLTVRSPMPIHWNGVFTWKSRIIPLDDTTVAITGGHAGFYLFRIDRTTGRISGDGTCHFKDHVVQTLLRDREGRLWIGCADGLWRQRLQPDFIRHAYQPVTLPGNEEIGPVPSPGEYWCGYHYQSKLYAGRYAPDVGLVILDAETLEKEAEIVLMDGAKDWNIVLSMQMYHPDTLWLGTQNGLLWLDTKTRRHGRVRDVEADSAFFRLNILAPKRADGYAWLAMGGVGAIARYDAVRRKAEVFTPHTDPAIPFTRIKSIAYDSYGDVWFGGHGLARWNDRRQSFDTLISVYAGPNKFDDDLLALQGDDRGSLWMFNPMSGLLEYRIGTRTWRHYGLGEGLPAANLRALSPVIGGHLWIADPLHLTRLSLQDGRMAVFDGSDGLLPGDAESRMMVPDEKGDRLYLFAKDDIFSWSCRDDRIESALGDVLFTALVIRGEREILFPAGRIELPARQNTLTVYFSLPDFEAGSRIRYAYRLHDEDDWTPLGTARSLPLLDLSPGTYALQVSATTVSGDQRFARLALTIKPPFWRQPWFLTVLASIAAAAGFFLYRRRVRSIRARADLDRQLLQAEMSALHAQMNPHFIFNSLNSIREMVLHEQTREASRYLGKFAHLIRVTLHQSERGTVSLRDTLDYLHRYVELEQIRTENFNFEIRTSPELNADEVMLPPMLIQPLIENAIWHGGKPDGAPIRITVDFRAMGNHLVCVIEDDGIGIRQSLDARDGVPVPHTSIGISNIRHRIGLLNRKHRVQSRIEIADRSELTQGRCSGTRVTIELPLDMSDL